MNLSDLSQEQKLQLKEAILTDRIKNVSYGELANADALVTTEELEEKFGATDFVEEDFFC